MPPPQKGVVWNAPSPPDAMGQQCQSSLSDAVAVRPRASVEQDDPRKRTYNVVDVGVEIAAGRMQSAGGVKVVVKGPSKLFLEELVDVMSAPPLVDWD